MTYDPPPKVYVPPSETEPLKARITDLECQLALASQEIERLTGVLEGQTFVLNPDPHNVWAEGRAAALADVLRALGGQRLTISGPAENPYPAPRPETGEHLARLRGEEPEIVPPPDTEPSAAAG